MSDRLEKLFTLTDVENLPEAPVTIEAGGLIKDNQTGRVIARMYLKNCSDKPLTSVLVGFRPKGENGKTISGMRDYLYDASGVPVGEIFGDQTGILFDNNETKSFSADVEGVDFEDGEFWDAAEAKKAAAEEELKLIVPEEKEQTNETPEAWAKPAVPVKGPEVWESESHDNETHSAEIYGAAIVEQKFEEPEEEPFEPASLQTWQLSHEEKPALEEETDAYKQDQEKAVIELDGPSDEEQPVIELDGPVQEEAEPEIEEAFEPVAEEAIEPAVEEIAEPVVEEAEPETQEIAEPEAVEPQPEMEAEEPQAEPEPEPAVPSGPVRLADMYGGVRTGSDLAAYADSYGMSKDVETPAYVEPEPETEMSVAEEAAIEPVESVEEPEVESVESVEEQVFEPDAPVEEIQSEPEVSVAEEPVAEPAVEAVAPTEEPEPARPSIKMDIENPWAGYSSDYAPPLGAVKEPAVEQAAEPETLETVAEMPQQPENQAVEAAETYAPAAEVPAEEIPAAEATATEAPATYAQAVEAPEPERPFEAVEEPAEKPPVEVPQPTETAAYEAPQPEETVAAEPEHIPSIGDTIELPKAVAPEKSGEAAEAILAAAVSKEEPAANAEPSVEATEASVEATEALVEAAKLSVEATELPVEAAEPSVEAAEPPIEATEASIEAAEEAAPETPAEEPVSEEVKATHKKADVVFAEETEAIPSLIEDNEKAITGEDHSARNLINIIVFGGIALVILLVLLIKM